MASETREHAGSYHRTLLDRLDTLADINAPLLAWYGTREGLPWRTDLSDAQLAAMTAEEKAQRAYEVWVSEIMLQQTQVATVIPYYQRWIAAFPTVASLAQADIEQVNSLWKGLGYYSRASRLLDGAKTVMSRYGGRLPSDAKTLVEQIEGIGPYTAGAISSIAFGARAATVDGNIQRVICRLLAIHADMKKKATLDYIWQVAEELVPESRAGHWNQALMDLGATVCTPKNPKCGGCPLKSACLAYAEVALPRTAGVLAQSSSESVDIEDISSPEPKPAPKKQAKTKATNKAKSSSASVCDMCLPMDPAHRGRDVTVYPCKVAKKASREEDIAVCVLEWQGGEGEAEGRKVLLVKRPKTGLLAGLDEFPSVIVEDAAPSLRSQASLALLHELLVLPPDFELASSNLTSTVSDLGSIKHIYSHINATFHVSHVVLLSNEGVPPKIRKGARERCRWVSRAEVESANISTGAVKVWSLVKSGVKAVKVKAPSKRKAGASHARSAAGPQLGQSKLAFGRKVQVQEEEMTASSSKENEVGEAAVSVAVAVTASLATTTSPRKKRRIVVSSDEEV